MNTRVTRHKSSRPSSWARAWQPVQARLQKLAPRERWMVLTACAVVGLALLWQLFLAPPLRTLARVKAERPALEAQWQQMLGLQQQARALQAHTRIPDQVARKALENTVKSDLGAEAQLQWSGARATISFKAVDAAQLSQWLTRARKEASAATVQSQLLRATGEPARWNGSVIVELPQS